MITPRYSWPTMASWLLLVGMSVCLAQHEEDRVNGNEEFIADEEEGVITDEAPVAEPDTPPPPPVEPHPAPDENVMRPTENAIRLTPRLADGFSQLWVREFLVNDKGWNLNKEQQSRLAEISARRLMTVGHKHDKSGADFIETFYMSMIGGMGDVPDDQTKQFGEKAKTFAPAMRELFGSVPEEYREVLTPEQMRELEEFSAKFDDVARRFEERMDRWSKGERAEDEEPFKDFEQLDEDKPTNEPESQEMKNAFHQARWNIRSMGPEQWKQWLQLLRDLMEFNDEQSAAADRILARYRKLAGEIMTVQWRRVAMLNRVRLNFQWQLQDAPTGPWKFHLEREWRQLTAPVNELERAFKREVLALTTPEQQDKVLDVFRECAKKHGMRDNEMFTRAGEVLGVPEEQ